jgi:hypothetical protein
MNRRLTISAALIAASVAGFSNAANAGGFLGDLVPGIGPAVIDCPVDRRPAQGGPVGGPAPLPVGPFYSPAPPPIYMAPPRVRVGPLW